MSPPRPSRRRAGRVPRPPPSEAVCWDPWAVTLTSGRLRRAPSRAPVCACQQRSLVPAEGVAGQALGVQRAEPLALALHPDAGVADVEREVLAVDDQLLLHLVGDDRDVVRDL